MQSKIQEAYSLQGYLSKKSPARFKGFQKRYFAIRDQGTLLIYYEKKPTGSELKPKGIITIRSIDNVATLKGAETEFIVVMEERKFHLKAESMEMRDKWIDTLTFLKELKTKDDGDNYYKKMTSKGDWSDLDKETMARIKLEDEKEQYDQMQGKLDIKNEEVMKCKGIYPYIQKLDGVIQDKYIVCGFLMKKGKLAKVTRAKRRWFIMLSSVPVNGEQTDQPGLMQKDVPDMFQLDCIYYFKYDTRGDQSNYIGKITAEECEDVKIMDLDKNQFLESIQVQKLPYGLSFVFKEREYNFYSQHLTEVDKWIKAFSAVKNKPKDIKTGKNNVVVEEVEVPIFEDKIEKKHQNKLLTGPLSWKQVTLALKKNSLSWVASKEDEVGNQYVLLIYIKSVEGKNKSFQVFMQDGEEYKFRAATPELKDKWVKSIQDQVDSLKTTMEIPEVFELPPEVDEDVETNAILKVDSEDEETITAKYYKKMAFNMDKNGSQEKGVSKSQSCFSKIFCCYGGGDSDQENDRGF